MSLLALDPSFIRFASSNDELPQCLEPLYLQNTKVVDAALRGLQSSIDALKEQLTELEGRYAEVQKVKDIYRTIISPIRKLPQRDHRPHHTIQPPSLTHTR
jgi:hypothetical protein